ncbi:apolipoprotein N-acyltransferase [Methylomicrobium album]|uniref:Apolipoprotein N-acyltransferase n=1 Tax=Methylomicrobium album BG8 TaxID=686340 RepID=H8GHG5_METAL|nr:apolipoprotein N-acyltransferase [Methylomicrobium album]EIC30117.1 apolipoprotein N-acyltransferase [Methylomicrobium album BG8]
MKNLSAVRHAPWLLPVLSGILIGTSYIPFPPWAALFCFVPLWRFWSGQTSLKPVLFGGLLTAFVFTLIGFNWVTYLLHEFAHLPWPLAVAGMLLYALLAHLFVPLAGGLWFWGRNRFGWSEQLSLALMALITTLCEAYSLTLFDWNFGYSWYGAGVPVFQWAEIVGFKGLSALTLLANLPLYWAWVQRHATRGKILLALVSVVFVLLNFGGLWLKNRLPEPDASINALLVQASIENSEKLAAELGKGFRQEIFGRYMRLTDQALEKYRDKKVDVALWPETAFPAILGPEFITQEYPSALREYLRERQLPLITGAYGYDLEQRLPTNSLFVLDKDGELQAAHYSKTILLAFGEYVPGERLFPQIRQWLPETGQFARGKGPSELLAWNGFKIGAQICYESLFPEFSRELAARGAEFIVNATNDSWYGAWQEPYQHMYMTLARGVEFRIPVLRVTNTGISTVALASGEILERSPLYRPWSGLYEVRYRKNPEPTFYQRWFYLVPALLWSVLLILPMFGRYLRPRQPS